MQQMFHDCKVECMRELPSAVTVRLVDAVARLTCIECLTRLLCSLPLFLCRPVGRGILGCHPWSIPRCGHMGCVLSLLFSAILVFAVKIVAANPFIAFPRRRAFWPSMETDIFWWICFCMIRGATSARLGFE